MCEKHKLNTRIFPLVDKKISDEKDINAIIEKGLTCLFSSNADENGITQDLKMVDSFVGLHFLDPYNKTTTKLLYDINKKKLEPTEFKNSVIELLCNKYILTNGMKVKCKGDKDVSELFSLIKNETVETVETVETKDLIDPFMDELSRHKITTDNDIRSSLKMLQHYKDFIYFLPPNFEFSISDQNITPGMMLVFSKKKLTENTIKIFQEVISQIILVSIPQSLILYHQKSTKKILKKSCKSAIAAIMSRNGSHNIGSHVLAAVSIKNNDLPDDQILFKYIQHRMDYIAQIATEFPDWTSPTWFVRDLMRRFYMQRHLLKYISQSEGLGAYEFQPKNEEKQKNKILIKIGKKGADGIKYIISPKLDRNERHEIKGDVQIAIPGGIIGHQAFYTIIENIIRNAAKHGWSSPKEDNKDNKPDNLEITIEIDDIKERDFIIFRIWDNVSKPIDDINEKLTKSFVHQETGHLLKSNWGLAEMKISAGFLNRREILQIGSDNKDDILFKLGDNDKSYSGIIRVIQSEDKKLFGYKFAIPRPKEVLLIGRKKNELDESLLQQNNIYLEDELTPDTDLDYEFVVLCDNGKNDFINKLKDYENESTKVKSEIESFPFRLLIASDDPELKPDKLDKSGFLSNRIVILNNEDDIKLGNAEEMSAFKLLLYKKWIRHLMKRRGILDNSVQQRKNVELKMLINLSGAPGHNQEDIVKLIFDRFKDSLLEQISSNEYSDAKNQLTEVTDADIHEYAKNNKKTYANANKLIDAWEYIVENKDSSAKIPIDLKKGLKAHAQIYFKILKDMYVRYDEDCQTLPKNYREKPSNSTGNFKGLCIDDGISVSITNNEDDKIPPFDIAYNRHDAVDAEHYSEALSGSQIYFSLLQNLVDKADKNDYERDKRILQLIENALLRVVIIDERVAQYYSDCNDQIRDRFVKGKFEVPAKITYKDKLLDLVNNADKPDNCMAIDKIDSNSHDVFIIHQGILDKIGLTDPSKLKELKELIDTIKELVPFVIITSGRGEPENIPDNARFLPFSNIESFVLSAFPEKYLLTQMAMKIITKGA